MRVILGLTALAGLALSGCGQQLLEFQKPGISQKARLIDDELCWKESHRVMANLTPEQRGAPLVVNGVVLGGPPMSSVGQDPRGTYYVGEHNKCMIAKGYEVTWKK
ncbi:MAG: hypothetical protein ABL901_16625 [Hyphomicrobiaceae bacterium]